MAKQAAAPTMKTVFHVDHSDAHPGEEYWLHACGKRHALVAHTPDSRRQARAHAPHLESMADAHLTHYTTAPVDMPAGSTASTLPDSFPNNTLGGQVKFEADYYLGDWLAGKATTGWVDNDEAHVAQVSLYLVEYPIPLSDKSIYRHTSLLTYQNNAYIWRPTATTPTATIASRDTSSTGNAISEWAGISLSQKRGMLGFAWKAAGMGIRSCISGQGGQLFAM